MLALTENCIRILRQLLTNSTFHLTSAIEYEHGATIVRESKSLLHNRRLRSSFALNTPLISAISCNYLCPRNIKSQNSHLSRLLIAAIDLVNRAFSYLRMPTRIGPEVRFKLRSYCVVEEQIAFSAASISHTSDTVPRVFQVSTITGASKYLITFLRRHVPSEVLSFDQLIIKYLIMQRDIPSGKSQDIGL